MQISVFTPTYNRAYVLRNLYESLCKQTYSNFEWIVVNDGSTDDTDSLINEFINEEKIKIVYFPQTNGGKYTAINQGVKLAKGELFFIVDSDDTLNSNALETIAEEYSKIKDDETFAGVSGVRIDSNTLDRIGGNLSWKYQDCNAFDIRFKHKVKGDLAEVFKTSILKQYPFPTFENEKFLSEGVVWWRIAHKYKLHYFNKGIYICKYQKDGLSHSIRKHHRNSPLGSMLYCIEMIGYKQMPLIEKIKAAINYWRYTIEFKGSKPVELRPKWWMWLFYPVGLFFYKIDLRK